MKRLLLFVLALALLFSLHALAGQLAAQGSHVLYLDDEGSVWAWGSNHMGESACTDEAACIASPRKVFADVKQAACGRQFSLALTESGEVWLWGLVPAGMLGNPAAYRAALPVKLDESILQIAACETAAALVTRSGGLRYFDGSVWREISAGASSAAVGADFVIWIDENQSACMLKSGETPESGTRVLMAGVRAVSASGQTALIVDESGALYAMGASGTEGRLGMNTLEWIDAPAANGLTGIREGVCGVSCSGAIGEDNVLYMWGTLYSYFTAFSEDGQMTFASADGVLIQYGKTPVMLYRNVNSAAIGDAFAAIEMLDGTLLSWGSNDWGQLGDGSVTRFELVAGEDGEDGDEDYEIQVTEFNQAVFPLTPVLGK